MTRLNSPDTDRGCSGRWCAHCWRFPLLSCEAVYRGVRVCVWNESVYCDRAGTIPSVQEPLLVPCGGSTTKQNGLVFVGEIMFLAAASKREGAPVRKNYYM